MDFKKQLRYGNRFSVFLDTISLFIWFGMIKFPNKALFTWLIITTIIHGTVIALAYFVLKHNKQSYKFPKGQRNIILGTLSVTLLITIYSFFNGSSFSEAIALLFMLSNGILLLSYPHRLGYNLVKED